MSSGLLRNRRGNWSLIGLLVAVVIAVGVYFFLLAPNAGVTEKQAVKEGLVKPEKDQTVYGAALDKGKETDCSSRLRQIRMSIEQYGAENGKAPASLQDLQLPASASFFACPVDSSKPYQYDPTAGKVQCTNSGHENL